jgi:hypothetical protein
MFIAHYRVGGGSGGCVCGGCGGGGVGGGIGSRVIIPMIFI